MVYCFVHAPIQNGWAGELLFVKYKEDGVFHEEDIKKIVTSLYPNEEWDDLIFTPHPSLDDIEAYLARREVGMMQRVSIAKTFEDLHFNEWLLAIKKHYKGLYYFLQMTLNY